MRKQEYARKEREIQIKKKEIILNDFYCLGGILCVTINMTDLNRKSLIFSRASDVKKMYKY